MRCARERLNAYMCVHDQRGHVQKVRVRIMEAGDAGERHPEDFSLYPSIHGFENAMSFTGVSLVCPRTFCSFVKASGSEVTHACICICRRSHYHETSG